ncbi:MAG: discoidin domain-containing protein [Caulobacteraceae bacterium]|nr:discoidin domain-containing protein [Caulobacteraceae bacterium]
MKLSLGALLAHAAFIGGVFLCSDANASTSEALISEGAKFVAASSASHAATGAALTIMQDDVISASPKKWLADGDKRYIFAPGDEDQWIEISLGEVDALDAFGLTYGIHDRPVVGPFYVETSENGVDWTLAGAVVNKPTSNPDLVELSSPVLAEYVKYFFGRTSSQYHSGGSALNEVFAWGVPAPALPEPQTWTIMILGVGAAGAALRMAHRKKGGLAAA